MSAAMTHRNANHGNANKSNAKANVTALKVPAETIAGAWSDATVLHIDSNDGVRARYQLNNSAQAELAAGCLLQPEIGDTVLLYRNHTGEFFITQVLRCVGAATARISVPGASKMLLEQNEIALFAANKLRLTSLRHIDLTAIAGDVTIEAKNLFSAIREQWIEHAQHRISKAVSHMLEATGLLRLHSEQGLMTAKKDLKVDAERISIG